MRIVLGLFALLLTFTTAASAQVTAPSILSSRLGPYFTIDTSTTPMTRNVVMGETAFAGFARTMDWGLDAASHRSFRNRSAGAFAARLGRFAGVDVWLAQYLFAWTHEYGHKTRVTEAGLPSHVVISGTPWTMTAYTNVPLIGTAATPGMYAAGMEATTVIARRVERRMAFDGRASYTDLTSLFVATGMGFGYIQHDLSAGRVREGFTLAGPEFGDPAGYVVTLASRRLQRSPTLAERQDLADDIRRASWLNLLDYNLVNVGVGLFRDYLRRGERETAVRWMRVGSVYLIPSLRYELTPIGPERQVRAFVRAGRGTLLT